MSLAEIVTPDIVAATDDDGGAIASLVIIFSACAIGIIFALSQFLQIKKVDLTLDAAKYGNGKTEAPKDGAKDEKKPITSQTSQDKLVHIASCISEGAKSFLAAEYKICAVFLAVFSIIIVVLVGSANECGEGAESIYAADSKGSCWPEGALTMVAFLIGGLTSMVSGYLGMMIAVYTNVRTTVSATRGWTPAFNTSFRGGAVMGFGLSSIALLVLVVVILLYKIHFVDDWVVDASGRKFNYFFLFEAVAGYGLGGSSIAMFGRVGGGIFTKAADVGADLVGKVEQGIPEDDPRNPATISDNVGDNVGDIAGMGSDLFGSFAESTCAALVLSAKSLELQANFGSLMFPLVLSAAGIIVCVLCSFVATHIDKVKKEEDVERVLKIQLILTTTVLTPVAALMAYLFLPDKFCFLSSSYEGIDGGDVYLDCAESEDAHDWWGAFISIACGLWAGLLTGLITEYYTSHSYTPVREVAQSSDTGPATLVIYGLALGYKSVIIPVFLLALTIFTSFYLVDLYGVSLAALGMLMSLSTGLTIDAYGPITDNAGGIAEMSELGEDIRNITDALDAAGNTTAAIGKGFAIGSALLVSLSLFGAFVSTVETIEGVDVLEPIVFAFLLIGAMLPYWFSALTMKSVGIAANAMVQEVRRQFKEKPGIMKGTEAPDYDRCIQISTRASLKEMIAPGALVILSPILVGYIFGVLALSGLLAGAQVSAFQLAISASNSGGAWDNAKKYVEKGNFGGKGSENHKAAVVGDTIGDPLKDTSGPALNILMKLMAIISLVFANSFEAKALPAGEEWAGY
eukprot:snap_masked-scaffold_6-processed-gene-5.23-mRNA-1 protein AED:0.00 eAED:0.00 QI:0/-1/0/1/-1/1/1/0/799